MRTAPQWPQPDVEEMRDRYHMQQSAIDGTLHIRSLGRAPVAPADATAALNRIRSV